MYKVIVGTIVVVLAGTCWVLAQNAASKPWTSPYGGQPVAAPTALLPEEKAELLTVAPGEPLVAPTTELKAPPLPTTPPELIAPVPVRPSVPTTPEVPIIELPPPKPANVQPPLMSVPEVPIFPAPELRPPAVPATRAAIPGLPPLPPIPGSAPSPTMTPGIDPRTRYEGIVVPQPANPLAVPSGPTWNGAQNAQNTLPTPEGTQPPTQVDPPNYWRDRQRFFDRGSERQITDQPLGPRIWGGAELLFWIPRPPTMPTLVQAVFGAQSATGTFTQTQVETLFPYTDFDPGALPGVRGNIGFWLNSIQTIGFETSYMWFGEATLRDRFQSSYNVILGRPYVDSSTGASTLYQVSSPGSVDGVIGVNSGFQMQGGDANFLFNSPRFGPCFNLLAGLRYLDFSETLRVFEVSQSATSTLSSFDQFSTRNQFWGGQVGLKWGYRGERLTANVTGKIGFGAMIEHATIEGGTTITTASGSTSAVGGVLALPTNIGNYTRTKTAFVPEASINLGYRFFPWATVNLGYNFLYSTEAVRPGGQIDTVVNAANIPFSGGTTGRPAFNFKSEDFWIQGISFGLTLQY